MRNIFKFVLATQVYAILFAIITGYLIGIMPYVKDDYNYRVAQFTFGFLIYILAIAFSAKTVYQFDRIASKSVHKTALINAAAGLLLAVIGNIVMYKYVDMRVIVSAIIAYYSSVFFLRKYSKVI